MFASLLTRIASALASRGVPHMVIGGQAVLVHGEPRLTRDIDITVALDPGAVGQLLELADELGLTPLPDDPQAFAVETMVLPVVEPSSGIRVDFILSLSTFEGEAIDRAGSVDIVGQAIRVATAEDLVVLKVIAGRPRDLEDARTILLRNPELDRPYVEPWLREFEAVVEEEAGRSALSTFRLVAEDIE